MENAEDGLRSPSFSPKEVVGLIFKDEDIQENILIHRNKYIAGIKKIKTIVLK